jgi:hypothetical protein
MSEEIDEKNWEDYSPYCSVCSGCGEEGCCSATICKQDPNGSYCKTYLMDLKFGYIMYKELMKIIDGDKKYEEQIDKIWDEVYDNVYRQKDEDI